MRKSKTLIRNFIDKLNQQWLDSKNRDLLSSNDIVILKDCLILLKEALETDDKGLENLTLLEVTKKLLLLSNKKIS